MELLLLAAAALVVVAVMPGKLGNAMTDFKPIAEDAIRKEIAAPMGLGEPAVAALLAQSDLETNGWKAWYFSGPQKDGKPPTFSLWNRHKGSGRGEWTGQTKYVGPGDEDLRIYTDAYQSARDFVELLNDPLYAQAKAALLAGSPQNYFNALHLAGFSTQGDYAAALQGVYDESYA